MELSCSCTSLISSYNLPTKPKPSSLSSSNSLFFSSNKRLASASLRTRGVGVSGSCPTSRRLSCRCIFGLGVPELVVIAGVAALLFGPKQLPEIGRNIGKTVKSFQQAAKEFETELRKEPADGSQPSEALIAISDEDKTEKLETPGTKENV